MDDQRKKTLMYAGAGGVGLGLVALIMRPKGAASPPASSAGIAADTTMFESLFQSVTEGYTSAIDTVAEQLRSESATEIKRVETETKTAQEGFKEEQAGLWSTFTTGITKTLADVSNQIGLILGRVTTLEATSAALKTSSEKQAKELKAARESIEIQQKSLLKKITESVSAEELARKKQAQLVGDTSRIAAARAAGFSSLWRWGTSQQAGEVSKLVKALTKSYGLTEQEAEAVRTWLQSQSNSLSRGEYSGGGQGSSFYYPVDMGNGKFVGQTAVGSIPLGSDMFDPNTLIGNFGIGING